MKWISIEQEVPADNYDLLLFDSNEGILMGYRHNDEWIVKPKGFLGEFITHWMYLKNVPKPKCGRITNDNWVDNLIKNGQLN